ncbi:MAG: thiol-disulfide oxidoreductase DCC family protein [Lysinibacillus sp.]
MGAIILFDGICNFCDSSVQFIIKRDHQGYFRFASIQSEIGQKILQQQDVPESIDSVILIEGNQVFIESTAALKISRRLDRLWPLCYVFLMVPPFIRDGCYRIFAKRRYRWFGKKESCMLPNLEERQRFL